MTKEKIIDTVLNSKVLEVYDAQNYRVYAAPCISREETMLSVCSKGIIIMYFEEDTTCYHSLIPFEEVAKIVISKKIVIE